LSEMRLLDGEGRECTAFPMGGDVQVEFAFASSRVMHGLHVGVGIDDTHGKRLLTFTTAIQPSEQVPKSADSGVATIHILNLPLTPGRYFLSPGLTSSAVSDLIDQALAFDVLPRDVFGSGKIPNASQGCFFHPASFRVVPMVGGSSDAVAS